MEDRPTLRAGAPLDLASHHVDLIRLLLGRELEAVGGELRSVRSDLDDGVLAFTAGGCRVTVGCSFVRAREDRLTMRDETGRTLVLDRVKGTLTLGRRPARMAALVETRLRAVVRPGSDPSYRPALRAFVDCAQGRACAVPLLATDGLASVRAIVESERLATRGDGVMKVLVVNDWTETGGGIERYLELVVEQLRRRGDEVRLLAGAVGDGAAADYPVRTSDRMAAQAALQLVNPWAVRQARRAVREFAPDVALVSMFEMRLSPAVLRALGRTPFVLCAGYYKPICPTGLRLLPSGDLCTHRAGRVCVEEGCVGTAHWARDQVRYALIRSQIRRAAVVVACSEYLRDELGSAGIEADWFPYPARPVLKPLPRVQSARPSFLFAGRFAPEKGLQTLFDGFARARPSLPGARLRLVGDGPLLPTLSSLAARYGIADAVDFVGWSSQEQLDGMMAEAWAVVVPSVWAEPFGLVALDAIVRGIPVVASDAGGLREIVDHGVSGLLVRRGDAGSLAEALVAVGTGAAFPAGLVPPEAVSRLAVAHAADRHVDWLRGRLEGAA